MSKGQPEEGLEIWSHDLSKVYESGGKEAFRAVNKINLNVVPGIHGFLGPNGAGKTTTINMLVGGLSITEGEARIRNKKPGSIDANQLIGFLPQDPSFYKNMTGEEYLIYLGKLGGLTGAEAKKRGQELLQYFDIWDARSKKLGKYSGGMKQKIGIAAALIHDPKILILDEPTANLDPIGRQNIIDRIKEISSRVSVFVSSHILAEIEQMCKRVTMINHGEIVVSDSIHNIKQQFIGNTYLLRTSKDGQILEQLKADPNNQQVWLDETEEEPVIKIVPEHPEILQRSLPQLLLDNDAILYTFRQPEVSLQDIFMTVMAKKGIKVEEKKEEEEGEGGKKGKKKKEKQQKGSKKDYYPSFKKEGGK